MVGEFRGERREGGRGGEGEFQLARLFLVAGSRCQSVAYAARGEVTAQEHGSGATESPSSAARSFPLEVTRRRFALFRR